MVVYLEEALARKAAAGEVTRAAIHEAAVEGAVLRLRPKLMTVSTMIAGLLPILWSTATGSEVAKPLATPVLGGMLSSPGGRSLREARYSRPRRLRQPYGGRYSPSGTRQNSSGPRQNSSAALRQRSRRLGNYRERRQNSAERR